MRSSVGGWAGMLCATGGIDAADFNQRLSMVSGRGIATDVIGDRQAARLKRSTGVAMGFPVVHDHIKRVPTGRA